MNSTWLGGVLYWYVFLFALGLIFFPMAKRMFPVFGDQGYALSKTLAILMLSYTSFLGGIAKLIPFTRWSLLIIIAVAGGINYLLYRQKDAEQIINTNKSKKSKQLQNLAILANKKARDRAIFLIIFEEVLFLAALIFLAMTRGQEPSVRGLEKFMDFGFMNSILRSYYFPPLDMWLSADPTHTLGYSINYYYFGHLTGAYLIKLTNVSPFVGYNLVLATIFAQAITIVFALVTSMVTYVHTHFLPERPLKLWYIIFIGLLGSFIVNFGGNLHTIYVFTTGYPNDNPLPFWRILSAYNPTKYWYPNATRFIPFTIHEFPAYSYVVADLHGHVFDIPFVLLTLSFVFVLVARLLNQPFTPTRKRYELLCAVFLGFMLAVHYMTNVLDGPIYLLLTAIIFFAIFKLTKWFFALMGVIGSSFLVFSFPFSHYFAPFASGIGVNCVPSVISDYFDKHKDLNYKLGPFLFLKENCQVSQPWMLFVLWGFFWIGFLLFVAVIFAERAQAQPKDNKDAQALERIDFLVFALFTFSTLLLLIPEFLYAKDIYPAHFRANTMFKLGYQAFIMMGIACTYVYYRIQLLPPKLKYLLKAVYIFFLFFVAIYPYFAFTSYYGHLEKTPVLDGSTWLKTNYPDDLEVIGYFNRNVPGQPIILEAQGDSYTDYDRISAYTGLPTVAGWWVHEWLWRGSSDVVGRRIPDIQAMFESPSLKDTTDLLKKYQVEYVVVSAMERTKYPKLIEKKFSLLGSKVFESANKVAVVYKLH